MQQATTVSLQMGFLGFLQDNPVSLNPIEIKEESVEGLAGFEPPTCGLGNRGSPQISLASPGSGILFFTSPKLRVSAYTPAEN